MKNIVVRLGEKSVNEFCRLRIELLKELKELDEKTDAFVLETATKQYYLSHINKDLISWGIAYDNRLAAIGSLCLFERIPYRENLSGLEGYILNIYTSPAFRNQGFANCILDEIIKNALNMRVKRLWLNSSVNGRNLYAGRGFKSKENEMELFL